MGVVSLPHTLNNRPDDKLPPPYLYQPIESLSFPMSLHEGLCRLISNIPGRLEKERKHLKFKNVISRVFWDKINVMRPCLCADLVTLQIYME